MQGLGKWYYMISAEYKDTSEVLTRLHCSSNSSSNGRQSVCDCQCSRNSSAPCIKHNTESC